MSVPVRWRFGDPKNSAEEAQRGMIREAIARWWSAFAERADDLSALFSQKKSWDLPAWMHEYLGAIDPRVMWEYGPAVRTRGHRLVLTPESRHFLRPLVEEVLARAPAIEGWEFYPHRQAEDVGHARASIEGRTRSELGDAGVRIEPGAHGRLDLTFVPQGGGTITDQAAFVATECLLGERVLDEWIGGIAAGAPKKKWGLFRAEEALVPLDRLKEQVDAAIRRQIAALPEKPWFERAANAQWSLFKLEPAPAEDFARQDDIRVAKSADLTLWQAAHAPNALFTNARFSRCGETFAYVKIDGRGGLGGSTFPDKASIEDAIDEVLASEKLGCHIGGGTGLIYSYIDVAITNAPRAIELIRERLAAGNVPRRSWILFYESALAAEWVGVYSDSPPPSLSSFD